MVKHLAFDLGAESGRVMLGTLEGGRLKISQLHRFPTGMVNVLGSLHWDVLGIYREMLEGMRLCAAKHTRSPASLAVDTWGIDFGLLDARGNLLGMPFAYRDRRTRGAMEEFLLKIPRERLHQLTGLEFRPIHTLFQLYAMVREKSPQLAIASSLLFMPDIFNYFLTGASKTEFTEATTSQLYNPRSGAWEDEIFAQLAVPRSLMQEIVPPETIIGSLGKSVSEETGLASVPVVAGASHDTAAAVAAVPASGRNFAYISSGTWSLMGIESTVPVINEKTLEYSLANQGGVGGTFMLLKNITGLWLLQQCQKEWSRLQPYSYRELVTMAEGAAPAGIVIDPDHPDFLAPPSMPQAIAEFCRRTEQPVPGDIGQFVRVIFESLSLAYRHTLKQLEDTRGEKIEEIYIVGGGSQNRLLCQFAADATGLPVSAGPAEATAIGNILVQAMTLGELHSLEEIRGIVRRSFRPSSYQPNPAPYWDKGYERFLALKRRG